jgi:hypothetical protein
MTEYLELNGDILHDQLSQSVLMVSFDKVNGERRDMTCTLDRKYLPIDQQADAVVAKPNKASLAVWDLNANGWRSFRLDRVINIQEVSYP